MFKEGFKNVEELERLEALEELNRDIAALPNVGLGENVVAAGDVPVSTSVERFPSGLLTPLNPGSDLQEVARFDAFVAERFVCHGFGGISGASADS